MPVGDGCGAGRPHDRGDLAEVRLPFHAPRRIASDGIP